MVEETDYFFKIEDQNDIGIRTPLVRDLVYEACDYGSYSCMLYQKANLPKWALLRFTPSVEDGLNRAISDLNSKEFKVIIVPLEKMVEDFQQE